MLAADRLVTELNALDVRFVTGGDPAPSAPPLPPAELLASLAAQSEARLRLALFRSCWSTRSWPAPFPPP